MNAKKYIYIGVLVLCAVLLGLSAYLVYRTRAITPQVPTVGELYTNVRVSNASFKEGVDLLTNRQYEAAADKLQSALNASSDPQERTLINYRLATALEYAGSYEEAVAVLKSIAADPNNARFVRAFAVQSMGQMFYETGDGRVTQAIFKDEPYASLYDASSVHRSYKRLFDKAASIYALPLSDLRAANWYASMLLNASAKLTDDPSLQKQYRDYLHTRAERANSRMEWFSGLPGFADTYAKTLALRAALSIRMSQLGETALADPETDLKEALAVYERYGLKRDAQVRVQYAAYLLRTKNDAKTAVSMLKPVVDPAHQDPNFLAWLKNERTDQFKQKRVLAGLASRSPEFAELLKAQGWTAADLKRTQ